MMGIEAVKSSTPAACRTAIKDAMKVIMNGTEDDTQEFISNFRDKFEKLSAEEIAFPMDVMVCQSSQILLQYTQRELLST